MGAGQSLYEARSAARLAALQALYQLEITGSDPDEVVAEFVEHRFGKALESGGTPSGDPDFFADLIRGVLQHQVEIDRSLAGVLATGWTLARIDSILRALLRAAAYEMIGRPDIPAKVIVDEYVELAHDFFVGEEPGFVNAVLDRLARRKRAREFGETPPDDELEF